MSLLADKHRRGRAPTIVALQAPTNGDSKRVYVFEADGKDPDLEIDMAAAVASRRREILQCLCCMLATFSFGIMLGWPSPTYPLLLDPIYTTYPFDPVGNFSIPSEPAAPARGPFTVTLVQSPLIAGLLMIGVIVATPFSSRAYTINSIKHGLLVALLAMTIGWIIMWQAANIFHLLVSRFIIGLGNGYAVGQIKLYIHHSALTPWHQALMVKMINIMMLAGLTCAYVMGIWLDFEGFAVVALVITAACYLATYFMPLGHLGDGNIELEQEQEATAASQANQGVFALFKTARVKRSTWLLIALTFVQQFSGAPATVVYSQVLLLNLGIPPPAVAVCALVYLLVYVAAYIVGMFYLCSFSHARKRQILLFSIVASILSLAFIILIIRLNLRAHDVYVPLAGMCMYAFFYGLGLGTIPNTYVEHLFDAEWRPRAAELQLMCFSGFAVIITKLLQVFFGEFPLEYVFVLFLSVASAGLAFVLLCLPSKRR